MKLSKESADVVKRFYTHRDRCIALGANLGEAAAEKFHKKFRGDPGSEEAGEEFKRLLDSVNN